jgi:hypothetical protein
MIFWHYRNDEDGDPILPWLLASCRLHDIAIPILYRQIAIEIHATGNLPISSGHLRHNKSLSVHIESHSAEYGDKIDLELEKGSRLLPAIKAMPALLSFSLVSRSTAFTSDAVDPTRTGVVKVDRDSLFTVLTRLPRTLRNLELEISFRDSHWPTTCPACIAIRRLMPRLHHLRLRTSQVCAMLLESFKDR